MEARDLRIGNWIKDKRGNLIQVESLHSEGINVYAEANAYGYSSIEAECSYESAMPIEISPERLEKCGFRHLPFDENDNYREPREDSAERERYAFQIGNNVWLEYVKDKGIDAQTGQPVTWWEWHINSEFYDADLYFWHQPKYLHHLQNLIHDLANEELKITQ